MPAKSCFDVLGICIMAVAIGLVVLALLSIDSCVQAQPSPRSIGSDLTILTHNDLYGSLLVVCFADLSRTSN
jgi:hypothetical protein